MKLTLENSHRYGLQDHQIAADDGDMQRWKQPWIAIGAIVVVLMIVIALVVHHIDRRPPELGERIVVPTFDPPDLYPSPEVPSVAPTPTTISPIRPPTQLPPAVDDDDDDDEDEWDDD